MSVTNSYLTIRIKKTRAHRHGEYEQNVSGTRYSSHYMSHELACIYLRESRTYAHTDAGNTNTATDGDSIPLAKLCGS